MLLLMVELKGNVKLSVCMPFRHKGVEVKLHAFVTPIFDTVCGQIYTPGCRFFISEKQPPVRTEKKAG